MESRNGSKRQLPSDCPCHDEPLKKQKTKEESSASGKTVVVKVNASQGHSGTASEDSVIENTDSVEAGEESDKRGLEVAEFNEIFVEVDDDLEFSHTKIILRRKNLHFYATTSARIQRKDEINIPKLQIFPIPQKHICPVFLTQVPNSISVDVFIKTPSLISYADSKNLTEISSLVMHEAQMCERMKRSPHPNIAKYFGCNVNEYGSITGLCFKRYEKTLYQMVKAREEFDRSICLSNIEAGIKHLHSLGIIHCDVNPHNVLLDTSAFVIADFDSCALEGDELGMKAGTDGWTKDDYKFAQKENDWFGFGLIKEFVFTMKEPSLE